MDDFLSKQGIDINKLNSEIDTMMQQGKEGNKKEENEEEKVKAKEEKEEDEVKAAEVKAEEVKAEEKADSVRETQHEESQLCHGKNRQHKK